MAGEGSVFHRVYCLDASDCALLSEDYSGTTRFHFQRELVACHSQANLSGGAAAALGTRQKQQVVLITGSSGRASVALHPTAEAGELQQALLHVQPAGDGNLTSALKLALLMSRRFPAGSTHITAFVASEGAVSGLTTHGHPASAVVAELRDCYQSAGLSLDVAVLCPRPELGEGAASALEALTGSSRSGSSSSGTLSEGDDSSSGNGSTAAEPATPTQASSSSSMRLVWLQPVATAAESWQQLEPALEQLERGDAGDRHTAMGSANGPGFGLRPGLPRRISREPRQFDPLRHPRTPLLAQRSGVQQPALCRGESLSRLGHLSSDGMMRPWLPTYSSIGQQAAAAAAANKAAASARGAAGGSGGKGGTEYIYIEVQPIPKWRTLLKVAAGRMLPDGSGPFGGPLASSVVGSLSGSGDYTAASAELLHSLQSLSVLADELDPGSSHGGSGASEAAGSAAAAAALPAPVTYRPDSRRGTLRLLQGTKEAHMLKLVWSPEPAAGDTEQRTQQQAQGFDMFSNADGGSGRVSAAHSQLLTYMPASAVAASAARGPLLQEGCELWEAAAEFECDLWLRTAELAGEQQQQQQQDAEAADDAAAGTSSTSSTAGEPLASVWARQLENGAQVLLVEPAREGGSPLPRLVQAQRRPAAAFWLQQHVSLDTLQLPAYATLGSKATPDEAAAAALAKAAIAAAEEPGTPSSNTAPVPDAGAPLGVVADKPGTQLEAAAQHEEVGQAQVPAALLAAALQRTMQQPPRVDLRRLRRDVKSGAIQVTPLTVGPLPATFVRDIVSARSSLLGGMGVENLDSWGSAGSSSGGGSAVGNVASDSRSSAASRQAKSMTAVGTEAASSQGAAVAHSPSELSEIDMQKHKAAAWSLLRQRLKQPSGRSGRGSSSSTADCRDTLARAAQDPSAVTEQAGAGTATQAGAGPASAAIPCSSPQPALQASHFVSDSCTSSAAGTPFGTPLHILASRLVHERRSSGMASCAVDADGASSEEAEAATAAAGVAGTETAGLPGAPMTCSKASESSDVLAGVSGQQDAHSDGIDPQFKLD